MSDKFKIPDVIYLQCHDDDGELLHPDDWALFRMLRAIVDVTGGVFIFQPSKKPCQVLIHPFFSKINPFFSKKSIFSKNPML